MLLLQVGDAEAAVAAKLRDRIASFRVGFIGRVLLLWSVFRGLSALSDMAERT